MNPMKSQSDLPVLSVEQLRVSFGRGPGAVAAVRGVSFEVFRGETLCLVGESGCGKSLTAKSILRLLDAPSEISGGRIILRAEAVGGEVDIVPLKVGDARLRRIRGDVVSMIFQEPMAALSPVHTIGQQLSEPLRIHRGMTAKAARQRGIELLDRVGIPDPARRIDSYSFQLSGGMRQRAMIAIALACGPQLLVADEPTTALDVTTQAQILELLAELQREFGMAMLFITHDLGVVAQISDRMAVMYLGEIVEAGETRQLFSDPAHPYTRALLRSVPRLQGVRGSRLPTIEGSVPPLTDIPSGCAFHTRCSEVLGDVCQQKTPEFLSLTANRRVACLRHVSPVATRTAEVSS